MQGKAADPILGGHLARFDKFISHVHDIQHRLILGFLFETGCRVSELVEARFGDIENERFRIKDKQTSEFRETILTEKTLKDLARYAKQAGIGKDNLLFWSNRKKNYTTRRIEQILDRYAAESGIKINPRQIRNLYLMKKLNSCKDSSELREATGLRSIRKPAFATVDRKASFDSDRDRIIYLILKETGCRTSELCSLKVGDVSGGTIHFTQSPTRSVRISKELQKLLACHTKGRSADGYLIPGKKDHMISPRRIQQVCSNFASASMSRITPRACRRNFAYLQYHTGASTSDITRSLGIQRMDCFNYGLVINRK